MRIKQIYYTNKFAKSVKRLSGGVKKTIDKREQIFRKNCFDPQLKTHKLRGKLKDYWSFLITYSDRILFKFISKDKALFLDVGGHQIYK